MVPIIWQRKVKKEKMRTHVYRNLDKPFQILSFNLLELSLFCFLFVGGNEVSHFFKFNPFFVIMFILIFGLFIFWIRRTFGNYFTQRFIRFLLLPSELKPKLLLLDRHI